MHTPPPSLEDIHQRVAKQVEVLIDSGYLLTTYIEIDGSVFDRF